MTAIEKIRINLIDKIQACDNEQFLLAIDSLFESIQSSKPLITNDVLPNIFETSEGEIEKDNLLSPAVLMNLDS